MAALGIEFDTTKHVCPGSRTMRTDRSYQCLGFKEGVLRGGEMAKRYPADPPLYVAINISSKHFSHAGFIGHVKDALEESAD